MVLCAVPCDGLGAMMEGEVVVFSAVVPLRWWPAYGSAELPGTVVVPTTMG
jgi:hypothetical protein